jgi:internalin A
MSISQRDDAEYPYSPKPAAVLVQPPRSIEAPAKPRPSWRFVGKWLSRLVLAAAVMLGIAVIPVGIVAYRARSQAAVIERLESLGCRVDYLGEYAYSGVDGRVRNYLRDKFGDEHFGDVFLVSALGLSPGVDASEVCNLCSRFDRLSHFDIGSESFRFDQIAKWEQLDNLSSLTIHSPSLTDDDLARIGQIPGLRMLELKAPKVTGAGLRHLSGAPVLSTLTIESLNLDGSGPVNEAGLPQLVSLTIQNSPRVRDQGIMNLGPMPELTTVTLENTPVGDDAVAHLAGSGKLLQVTLIGTQVSDRALESLSNCPELQQLYLSDANVTDAGIAMLAKCQNLSTLDISGTKVTGKGLAGPIGTDLALNLDRTDVTDEGLHDILQNQGLAEVSLQNTKVTGTGVRSLTVAGPFPVLNLAGAPLTREGIEALAKSKFPSLCLARTPIDDKALMLFMENDVLTGLDVSETKVTPEGVKAFYEARKLRLAAAGREESLYLTSDHPDIVDQYLPELGMSFPGFDPSLQPDGSLPPDASEQQSQTPPPEVNPN